MRLIGLFSPCTIGCLLMLGCGGVQEAEETSSVTTFDCRRDRNLEPRVARRMTQEALPAIWEALGDPSRRACWESAITAAGFIGGPEVYPRLRTFIESRGQALSMSEDFLLIQRAYSSLGTLVALSSDPTTGQRALDYLVESTNPVNLEKRSAEWGLDAVMRREVIRVMALSAVSALGLTQRPEAFEHLQLLATDSVDRRTYGFRSQNIDAASDGIEGIFMLHALPPGRIILAMNETLPRLGQDAPPALHKLIERVRSEAQQTFDVEQEWVAARQGRAGFERAVRQADQVADARLSGLHGQLESLRNLLDLPEEHKAIDEITEITFPDGPITLINLPFPDQVKQVLDSMEKLRTEKASAVKRLKLDSHVDVVTQAHQDLKKALESGEEGAGFEAVIEKRSSLQILLHTYVATVIASYPEPKDSEKRNLALRAVFDQDEQVSNAMNRLVAVRDVDPRTGQELSPLIESTSPDSGESDGDEAEEGGEL